MAFRDPRVDKWMRQWVGAFTGAALGWLMTVLFPDLALRFSVLTVVLWGAAIGALLTSLGWFVRRGSSPDATHQPLAQFGGRAGHPGVGVDPDHIPVALN